MSGSVKQYIYLLTIIVVTTSFVHKDLNEYGQWLQFYNIKDEDFKQVGTDRQLKLNLEVYNLSKETKQLYESLFFYSPDSIFFLDLYSYRIILEKDTKSNLTWSGGDSETKVQLVKTKSLTSSTLLFIGSIGFIETAIWRNKYLFEVFGFQEEQDKYIPTIWKYDLKKNIYRQFECVKTFKIRPRSYFAEVRMKSIKLKE